MGDSLEKVISVFFNNNLSHRLSVATARAMRLHFNTVKMMRNAFVMNVTSIFWKVGVIY